MEPAVLTSFIIAVIAVTVGGILLNAGILFWVTKRFRIEKSSYKKSLLVLTTSGIVGIISGVTVSLVSLGSPSALLANIVAFFVFHYFYKKYYQISLKKSFGIYIIFGIASILFSLVTITPIRLYVVSPFFVSGEAMSPAYNDGDYLLTNKFDKNFSRGDVVIFQNEKQPNTFLIKRIVGLPSEKIEIKNGNVFINGQVLDETPYYSGETAGNTSVILEQDQYFVLGDNREKSFDSRSFGPINKSEIEGKVSYKIFGFIK